MVSSSASKPSLLSESAGLSVINVIPSRRKEGKIITSEELSSLNALLGKYLASENNKLRPKKDELFNAVQALLKNESRSLSRQWDKTQLALTLFRWVQEAFHLGPEHCQADLSIVINTTSDSPNQLGHDIYLKDEVAGETETFAIQSPSPSRPARTAADYSGVYGGPKGLSREDLDAISPSEFDASLLMEMDALANRDSLAAIPTLFTPRVRGKGSDSDFGESPAGRITCVGQ